MIEVNNLTIQFTHVKALADVSMEVYEYEKVAFIGANGSGKSTLVKTLVGINKPTKGYTKINGIDCWQNRDKVWNLIELLNLDERLPDAYNTYENMQLFSPHLNMEQIRKRAEELLGPQVLDMKERDRLRPLAQLSTGTRQKGTIAALRDLPYVVLDEPTMGFDPNTNFRFRTYVMNLKKTTIWITHNMLDAEKMERVFVIRYGQLVGWGTPEILLEWTKGRDLEDVYRILTATENTPIECKLARVQIGKDVEAGKVRVSNLKVEAGQVVMCGKLTLRALNACPGGRAEDLPLLEIAQSQGPGVAMKNLPFVERGYSLLRGVPVPLDQLAADGRQIKK
jgi:ABC-2 type transport system ATP-binding protein